MKADLLLDIQNKMSTFSKGQKKIAQYLLEHLDKAAFMTAAKLSKTVGTSESTVVRFATEIGFEGYPQMQKALKELSINTLTSIQRMGVAQTNFEGEKVYEKVMHSDIDKIKETLEKIDAKSFDNAVDLIVNAQNIYIVGNGSASMLSNFLGFYLNHIFDNVKQVGFTGIDAFDNVVSIGKNDVLIAFSFPRYSSRTVNSVKYASKSGASVVAITDSQNSPIAKYSDNLLIAQSDMASFVDSLVAPLSLLNALIVALGKKREKDVSDKLSKLEEIWQEYDFYNKR